MQDHVSAISIQVKRPVQSVADSMIGMKVRDFQSIPVVVAENISVYDAICHMFLEDVGTLFVVNIHHYLLGVLSRKDLLRTSLGNNELDKIPVHVIMTRMPNITYCDKAGYAATCGEENDRSAD